jgi:hypothetical protein
MTRQRKRIESFGSNDTGAINGLTDRSVLFKNLDVKTFFSQQSCSETTRWPTSDNNNITHEKYSDLFGNPDIFLGTLS